MKIKRLLVPVLMIAQIMIITSIGCSRPKKENLNFLKDPLSYQLINAIIDSNLQNFQGEYSKCKYLLDKEPYSVLTKRDSMRLLGLDTIFSKNDLDTIFKQNAVVKNYSLKPEYLNVNITIIPTDSLLKFVNDSTDFWDCYYNKYGRYGYAIIAPPLFSLDRQTAIVKYSCQFHGLNGEFHTHIYKKKGNKWKVIYILYDAIS